MFLYMYIFGMAALLVFKQFCVYNKKMSVVALLVNSVVDLAMYVFLFIAFPKATLVLFLVLEGVAMIQRSRANKAAAKTLNC